MPPEVECISKGKAHKRYEFGCKVSVAATSRGGWFVDAMAIHGNPYDGHTLSDTLSQVNRISKKPFHAFVDRGYRGHDYKGDIEVHIDKVRRGRTARSLWRWMKRRAAVEPGIGHLKREHRMDRNRLKGTEGDKINAILSAAGMNFSKLLRRRRRFCWWFWWIRPAAVWAPILAGARRHSGRIRLRSEHTPCVRGHGIGHPLVHFLPARKGASGFKYPRTS